MVLAESAASGLIDAIERDGPARIFESCRTRQLREHPTSSYRIEDVDDSPYVGLLKVAPMGLSREG